MNFIIGRTSISSINSNLLEAAKEGDFTTVKNLLNKGATPNIRDSNGMTILAMAAIDGDIEVINLLLEKGADVNAKRYTDGLTPLI